MSKFKIVLKNGFSFDMECENVKVTYSTLTGEASKFNYEGCTNNIPIYLDVSQIVAVIQEEVDNGENY